MNLESNNPLITRFNIAVSERVAATAALFGYDVELHLKLTHFPPRIASKIDPRITLPSRPFSGGFRSDKRGIIECNSTLAPS